MEASVDQNAIDATIDSCGSSHGYTDQRSTGYCCKLEQHVSIGVFVRRVPDSCTITYCLSEVGKFLLQPPCRGAKPKKRGVKAGEQLQIEVSLNNMRLLVRQNHAQFNGIPCVE
jgi:hypothetical protein